MPLSDVGLEIHAEEERGHSRAAHDHNPPH